MVRITATKGLEERQREMRERMAPQSKARPVPKSAATSAEQTAADLRPNEKLKLEQHIASLEAENAAWRAENESLRRQKIVYVERQKSAEEERRERVHNYFKYSNARRW